MVVGQTRSRMIPAWEPGLCPLRWVVMSLIVLKPNENRTIYCSLTHRHLSPGFSAPIEMMGDRPTARFRHQGLEPEDLVP